MVGKLGWRGIIAVIFIGGAVIVASNNSGRTVHQPINLMAGTPNTASILLTTPTSLPVIVVNNPTEAPLVVANASIQNVVSQAAVNLENARIHTVQDGETLYRIGLQYNLTAESIAIANRITDVTQIYAGQTPMIPGKLK